MATRSSSRLKKKKKATKPRHQKSRKSSSNRAIRKYLNTYPPVHESTDFYNPDFPRIHKDKWEAIKDDLKAKFHYGKDKIRAGLTAFRNGKSLSSFRLEPVMDEEETGALLKKVMKLKKDATTIKFYEGAAQEVDCVYAKHDLDIDTPAEGILNDPGFKKLYENCKDQVLKLPGVTAADVKGQESKQIFFHFYSKNDEKKEAPWHRDVDANVATAIVLLAGDGKDEIHTSPVDPLGKPSDSDSDSDDEDFVPEVVKPYRVHTPKPGEAFIMSHRLYHAVPARNRDIERVVAVIWF
jgi:hypothetical protein